MAPADEQADIEIPFVLATRFNEDLLNAWQAIQGHGTEATVVYRHLSPAHNFQALFNQVLLDSLASGRSTGFVRG